MKITIDNREIEVRKGRTVLDAAEEQGIYIPHLCSHPQLTPYGGCRLCCVEIVGMRGYPTACTTQAAEGMVIRTHSNSIEEMRREILQLILSEHPSGCLVCEEDCNEYMGTIRKVGTTTGCRWCPEDGDCELQKVVEHLEVGEITFPVYYRGLPIEKYDPFFDRDYNLCIYCGRCVRICQEFRKSSVIALKQRGKQTIIGPSFDRTHVDADCEFCGACVSVCPTGAMSEKNKKWCIHPDNYVKSYCPLCGVNCEIQALTQNGRIVGTLPPGDPHQSGGELCVKGRFCLSELVNHPDRVVEPQVRFPEGVAIMSWDDAAAKAWEQIEQIDGKRTAVYISPDLTVEEITAATQFALKVIQTPYITSTAITDTLPPFIAMDEKSVPLKSIRSAGSIISVFLDGNYGYAPVTLAIKRAAEKGTPYIQVGWNKDTTSRFATQRIIPTGGDLPYEQIVTILKQGPSPLLIIGPSILEMSYGRILLRRLETIANETGTDWHMVNPYGNLFGLLSTVPTCTHREVTQLIQEGKIDLLYLIGSVPFSERHGVKCIVSQNVYPVPDGLNADIALPASTWAETGGTLMGPDYKKKKYKAVVKPPGKVLPHREIFQRIAKAGKNGTGFNTKTLSELVPAQPVVLVPENRGEPSPGVKPNPPDDAHPYLLVCEAHAHSYLDTNISKLSGGMQILVPPDTLIINPKDAVKLQLSAGDSAVVQANGVEKEYPVVFRKTVAPGYIHLVPSPGTISFATNPVPVNIVPCPSVSVRGENSIQKEAACSK